MLPFHLGSDAQFAAVRDLFAAASFTEQEVCQRGGVDRISQFRSLGEGREASADVLDALDLLIRLFLDGVAVPAGMIHRFLPEEGLRALLSLGLIAPHPDVPDRYAASVLLYPIEGLYIASDLEDHAPGLATADELERADHVFSGMTTLTATFLEQISRTSCDRFLELCAGTGVAALAATGFSGHTWALDITERSTRFAEFNARLNGIRNFTALQGDLYEPVAGMTFDRIVAHPPYVPASETQKIYRDGGKDGEEILVRILAGLPDHLSPGGHFFCTCVATDRTSAPLEERIRSMIGPRQDEFDMVLVVHHAMPPAEYYCRLAAAGRIPFATAEQRHLQFRALGAERVVYCSMALQRRATERPAFTVRRERGEHARWSETDRLMGWSTTVAEQDVLPALLDARAQLSPHAKLEVRHRVEEGQWKIDTCQVRIEHPFVRTVELSLNAAMLLTLFDGSLTTREILQRLKAEGAVAQEVPEVGFAEFVRKMVDEGVLGLGEPVGTRQQTAEAPRPTPR